MKNQQNETVIEGFTFKTFEPAPDGFDPITAPQDQLDRHGIPTRPDKEKDPELYQNWHKIFSRKLHHIVPQFTKSAYKPSVVTMNDVEPQTNGTFNSSTWSGVVVTNPANNSFTSVSGSWIVPHAYSNDRVGDYTVAAWVGIDGFGAPGIKQAGDVLQAGTTSTSSYTQNDGTGGTGIPGYSAWIEWYPIPSVTVSNLPVTGGNNMFCSILVKNATTASIIFINLDLDLVLPFQITAKPGVKLLGNTAEWIIEDPGLVGVPTPDPFPPYYTPTVFDGCGAGTKKDVGVFPGTGNIVNMVRGSTVLSEATILNNDSLVVFQPNA